MDTPPSSDTSSGTPAFAFGVDVENIITKVTTPREAKALPCGTIVGDLHGGVTFTDAVAAVLEQRSVGGWQEFQTAGGETWTLIVVNR